MVDTSPSPSELPSREASSPSMKRDVPAFALPFASHPPLLRYAISVGAVLAVLVLNLALSWITVTYPFLLFLGAVAFSAWYGGLGPGMLATLISAVAATYFFLPPLLTSDGRGGLAIFGLAIFLFVCLFINALSYARQEAEKSLSQRAEAAVRERENLLHELQIERTRLQSALADLQSERTLLDTIIEGAPIGLSFVDRDIHLVKANALWADMTGTDLAEAYGRSLYEFLPGAERRRAYHMRVLAGESLYLSKMEFAKPGAEARFYDLYYTPLRDLAGKVTGMLVAMVDVTEHHEIDRQKDEFIALASHELKSPVTSIKGYSQMLLRALNKAGVSDPGTERQVRALQVMDEQCNRLVRLINELLDVTRLNSNALTLHSEQFDLRTLTTNAVSNSELINHDFSFKVDLPPTPVTVEADPSRIEQVLMNLLQNAAKYSTDRKQIEVTLTLRDGEAITSVRDHGVGIPPDEQAQVFNRFFRARNVQHGYAGLGLGLFISNGIIERHGGRMWCESVEGEGSTFYFALPAAQANASGGGANT